MCAGTQQTLAEQTAELLTLPQQMLPVLCACVQSNSSHCCPLSPANHSKASRDHEPGIFKAVTSPSIFEKRGPVNDSEFVPEFIHDPL